MFVLAIESYEVRVDASLLIYLRFTPMIIRSALGVDVRTRERGF
jgi:hypothetical protein